MASSKLFNAILIACVCIQCCLTQPYQPTCEDQLLSYRKFILTAVLNFEDICDASVYDGIDERTGLPFSPNPIRFGDIRNRPEVWAFFRMLMAQFKDAEFIGILKDAIIDKCKEKSQTDKRDGVVIGKKQRFHSWGGKRANNLAAPDSAMYQAAKNSAAVSNLEAAKYATWTN